MREQKQLEIFNNNLPKIIEESLKNQGKTGRVELLVGKDFQVISLKFEEGKFNKKKFTLRHSVKHLSPEQIKKAIIVYYSILWWDNETIWNVKEPVFLYKKDKPIHNRIHLN